MSDKSFYPEPILNLPGIKGLTLEKITPKLMQAEDAQIVFFTLDEGAVVPLHTHKDQWGVVLSGKMEMNIDGQKQICEKGDTYFIPAGIEHGAVALELSHLIDVFFEPNRYEPDSK